MSDAATELEAFMDRVRARDPDQSEFHQAVEEIAGSLIPWVREHPEYREGRVLERLVEPDRVITFRVTWEDDDGGIHVNRAWRVQFSNAIGPYKGGLRFHPSVNLGILKFLGFEQVFKNSLTGLPLGGAKGGADFDPKGRSEREVMRFCQALMVELQRHIGEDTDVPAGDIGVGPREISWLFGQYKRMANRHTGLLTGKNVAFGGSPVRREATGYGVVYFTRHLLEQAGEALEGRTALVSGAGNVALYCIEKLAEHGVTVVTASDSDGFVHDPAGIAGDRLAWLRELKEERRGRIHEYAERFDGVSYHEGERPWGVEADLAFPCATENELEAEDARALAEHGVLAVVEGANMPCTSDARRILVDRGVLLGPGKAANAGGVAVSGLEHSQNRTRIPWSREEVDERLQAIMARIHRTCVEHGREGDDGPVDYTRGANLGGFVKVADALIAQGIG